MEIHVYKEYLEYLSQLKKKPSLAKKSLTAMSALALVIAVIGASSLYIIRTKIIHQRQALDFIERAKYSIVQTAQTLNDVTAIYKVAGAKTEIISAKNESTPSSQGFNTTISDIQKSINGLDAAKNNIEIQKNNIFTNTTPQDLKPISAQIYDYMDSSQKVLLKLKMRQGFYKQMQLTLGPNFYLPKLESDNLWGKLPNAAIVDYYQKTASDATSTIEKLATINTPDEFKTYYENQGKYLELVRDVSEKIVKILAIDESSDPNSPSQAEKAYQLFLGASAESKNLTQAIESEKLKFQSATETINLLAETRLKEQTIEVKLNDIAGSSKFNPDNFWQNILNNLYK